ncbi:hypothetical protein [Streptacidiphilus fuscans]|uniref:Uncharacterized protein n=1 Tax=Streptacidiphilus fuscans TaxID=2789292 RepID=A0A931B0S2_9ACTN|nr:hypothetical protein [Streptacidiphilus fuscans]MBF9067057.1 hypothetical protein [Streptacidiphilus fuscans]
MKKILALGALTLTSLAVAAPGYADTHTSTFDGGGVRAVDNHNHATTAGAVPQTIGQQLAVIPALGSGGGGHGDGAAGYVRV